MSFLNKKMVIVLFFLIPSFLLIGCSKTHEIPLKEWIHNENLFRKFIRSDNPNCLEVKKVYEQLTLEEFQSKMYSHLLECNQNDVHKVEKYLLKSVRSGLHPERLDTIKYSVAYAKIRDKIFDFHHEFWRNRDTTYFAEIEKRVLLDQKYRAPGLTSKDTLNKIKVIENSNEKYLLKLCKESGFPLRIYPSKFNSYRIIDATIIAMHASDSGKVKLLKCATKDAKNGKISWMVPINICIALFSSEKSHKDVYPLWYLFYDNKGSLKVKDSYLQLYSIKKLFDQDNFKKIKIQPSKYIEADKKEIRLQLKEIRNVLIHEFSFSPERLKISDVPDSCEVNYRNIKPYSFTLSILE